MLRSAEEIAAQTFNSYAFSANEREAMIKVINQSRKEVIEECIANLKIKQVGERREDMPTGSQFKTTPVYIPVYEVDKQPILNLIDQLK